MTATDPQTGVPYPLYDCFLDDQGTYPTPATMEDRAWFERARLGMFVHWNHSSVAACEISWAMHHQGMEMAEYEALATRFNPVDFSADAWVELAQEAGMGYLLLVVKHHDGFAMWDTRTSDYKITNTPFGRDVCREIADACHRAKMPLGWYYSPADWWHPASRAADWDTYVPYMQAQLRELMTEYGQIDFLAFDYWSPACMHASWAEFYRELRGLCPHFLHSRNTPWAIGDYEVMEHRSPYFRDPHSTTLSGITAGPGFTSRMTCAAPFEVLLSIQPRRWSFATGDAKPLDECVRALVDAAGSGGNLTLNVTPNASGVIPAPQAQRLRELGAWMATHGQAIVGTQGGPLPPLLAYEADTASGADALDMLGSGGVRPPHTRCRVSCTSAGQRLYLHVIKEPTDLALVLPTEVATHIVSCHLLNGDPLPTIIRDDALWITLPRSEPDLVIVVNLSVPAEVLPPIAPVLAHSI